MSNFKNEIHEIIQKEKDKIIEELDEYLQEIEDVLVAKNSDYGFSFHKSLDEYGIVVGAIRIDDKLNRLKQLIKYGEQKVENERLEDTVTDLIGYGCLLKHFLKHGFNK